MIRAVSLAFLLLRTLDAQPAPTPRFEVAAIHLTPPELVHGPSGGIAGKGRYAMHNRTLKDYIWRAYLVEPNRVIGGPPWLDSERFDINAKAEQPIDDDKVIMAMLRTLLEERFKLKLHRESRIGDSLVLGAAKGGSKLRPGTGESSSYNNAHDHLDATNLTMMQFAEILSRDLNLPVVDGTGLTDAFNFALRWNPDGVSGADPGDAVDYLRSEMSRAIAQQLGLSLKFRRTHVEMLVIDQAEEPSEN